MAKAATDTVWRDFIQWCAKRRLRSLPAHPWTLAAYLRWRHAAVSSSTSTTAGPLDLKAVTDAIRKAHRKADRRSPHRDPIVERTMALIRNKQEARSAGSDLFDADSLLFSAAAPPPEAIDEKTDDDGEAADDGTGTGTNTAAGRRLSSKPRLVSRRPRSG